MPFISGGTLQGVLEKQQTFLEQDQVVFYMECICAALDYAHKWKIVHLDLKPLNLLLHEDGRLLLSDFGLAHLMKDGAVAGGSSLRAGTPHYMAPEHIKGFPEKRSDLFSLGVILYQMLVGRLPFDGLSYDAILMKNMTEWPPAPRLLRPDLPQAVEDILARALTKRPEERYQTASDFLAAFKTAITVFPQKIRAASLIDENALPAWIRAFPETS
jgi:serine/threonine-protein kinase